MSQSSNSPMDDSIFPQLSATTMENKTNSSNTQQKMKRVLSDQFESTPKRIVIDHHSAEKQVITGVVPKPVDQAKFTKAAEMTDNVRTNVQLMPEIPDEELLKMALEFEKKYPQ